MYTVRKKDDRGKTLTAWLDSSHTFSFGEYYDPSNMGYSDLIVINDDVVSPERGFTAHRHNNMEIVSIILDGTLEHQDNLGTVSTIRRGEIQRMSAGSGVVHSEYNPSETEPVHFLQIWVQTNEKDLTPEYEQKEFSEENMLNKLCLIVSSDGRDGSLKMHQDIEIYQTVLEADKVVTYDLPQDRNIWIHIAQGAVEINKGLLEAGDGLGVEEEKGALVIQGVGEKSNVLIFNLR